MPHKIGFTVIYASGEDERHRASELNVHGPTVRGWQSPRDCSYPQELVLQLHRPAAVHRIQVLSHHFLIPEKVELWLGEDCGTDPDELEVENGRSISPSSVRFEYLGFITLSDNCATEYKSRELKSVTVPGARARFVKLRLHRNHRNLHNPHDQVSLIAVNIIGIADDLGFVNNMNGSGDSSLLLLNNPQYTSPYDDLAFEMYVDPEVATIIRSMEIKKHKAVLGERFEYARKLKVAMIELRAAGEALAKLELEKRRAIAREDFDRAKDKKAHMDRYRSAVYACLDVDSLLEINGLQTKNDDSRVELLKVPTAASSATVQSTGISSAPSGVSRTSPVHATGLTTETSTCNTSSNTSSTTVTARVASPERSPPPQQHHHHHHSHQHGTPLHNAPSSHHQATSCEIRRTSPSTSPTGGHQTHSTPGHRTGSLRRRGGSCGGSTFSGTSVKAPSPAKTSYEAYEERTLPALRHCHTTSHRDFNLDVNDSSTRSKLSDREKKQAALPISVFGNDLVEKFYSKQFCDKEEGLRTLMSALEAHMAGEACPARGPANKIARAAVHLLHRALRDKVFSVYSLAAHAIRLFFTQFVPARVSPAEVGRSVDRLLPDLLSKSGDPTPRIHNMAVHTILTMADCQEVKELHVIPVLLTRPLTSSTHPRLALSRLEMVEQLVLSHGISQDKHSGLTCRILSELGAAGLHHPAEAVRKVAERILVLVYRVNPRLVRKQLPPDDDITRRNLLYRQLFHEFDKLDIERKKEILERNAIQSTGNTVGIAMSQSATCLQASGNLAGHPPPASLMSSSLGAAIANVTVSNTTSKSPPASSSSSASIITSPSDISHQEESGITLTAPSNLQPKEISGDRICIFCQNKTENFNEEGLNIHYWRSCPMLMRCHNCKQVVEIAAFARHLAHECEKSDEYRLCQKCKLAISSVCYDLHISTCNVGDGVIKCPLCQAEIQGTLEASWRHHLMVQPCPKHPRRKHLKTRSHSPSEKP